MSSTTQSRTRRRTVRRNRITPADARLVAALAAATAVASAMAGMRPTAWRPADIVVSAVLGALVAWTGASAPWWLLAIASGLAALTAVNAVAAVAAAVAFVAVLVVGGRSLNGPVVRAAAAGVSVVVLFHLDVGGFHGSSALVTGAVVCAVVVGGLMRRGRYVRLQVRRALIGVAALAGVAVVGAVIGMIQAAGAVRDGEQELRAAASALRRGDVEDASDALARSRG
ncbi:MAG: hypothetical protein M3501_11090, partial [Actinomycetota bacterium]|nr:hypothetical protein [Actinomycetota bacterium]